MSPAPEWQPGLRWRPGSGLPEVVDLPTGEFEMGELADDKFADDTERPRRRVIIDMPIAMGVTPVTTAEWAAFQPSAVPGPLPIVGICHSDATAFCAWLGEQSGTRCRLPSEAEWEFAARAGSRNAFPRGDVLTVEDANFYYDERGNRIGPGRRTPVGAYASNAFGLHDMLGNVCEWTLDPWHRNYAGAPNTGVPWIAGGQAGTAVVRGGAWDYLPRLLRPTHRDWLPVVTRRDNLGFRIVIERL